jgi:hypothetical protein
VTRADVIVGTRNGEIATIVPYYWAPKEFLERLGSAADG